MNTEEISPVHRKGDQKKEILLSALAMFAFIPKIKQESVLKKNFLEFEFKSVAHK